MGWASANQIFDPVAQELIDAGASDELKTRVLATLINQLQEGDWDTEDESLDEFKHDPAIVAAFRENGIYAHCEEVFDDGTQDCDLEVGHDSDHRDHHGNSWARGNLPLPRVATVDYTRRRWGHDYTVTCVIDDGRGLVCSGWGPELGSRLQAGDFLILEGSTPGVSTRYEVATVRYHADPPDMWTATLRFAPRGASPEEASR